MTPRIEGCWGGEGSGQCAAGCVSARGRGQECAEGTYGDVDHFQPVRVADQVVGEHDSSLQAGVGPFPGVWVGNIEAGDSDSLDLVALFGDEALDDLLVSIVEDRGHGGGGVGWAQPWAGLVESEKGRGQTGVVDSRGWCLLLAQWPKLSCSAAGVACPLFNLHLRAVDGDSSGTSTVGSRWIGLGARESRIICTRENERLTVKPSHSQWIVVESDVSVKGGERRSKGRNRLRMR